MAPGTARTESTTGADAVTDPEGLAAVIRSLIEGWSAAPASGVTFGQKGRVPSRGRFVLIHSFAAHTHRLAAAALDMLDAGLTIEVLPLIRQALESALTAVWLAQNEDAGNAFANEHIRQRRSIRLSMERSPNPVFANGAATLPDVELEDLDSASNAQARSFQQLCDDLAGARDLYLYYRLLSEYIHPSMRLAEQYVLPDQDRNDIESLLLAPNTEIDTVWRWCLAASVLWAGTAVDYVDVSRRRRSELRAAARAIGTQRDLQLTPQALERVSRSAKLPRPETRRGPWGSQQKKTSKGGSGNAPR
jgi:hypothetical protein